MALGQDQYTGTYLRSEEESHNASSAKVHLATEPFLPLLSNLSNYFFIGFIHFSRNLPNLVNQANVRVNHQQGSMGHQI